MSTLTRSRVEWLIASSEPLAEWLDTKQPNDTVGYPATASMCPITCFLRETLGISEYDPDAYVETFDESITVCVGDGFHEDINTPGWVQAFVYAVDEMRLAIDAESAREILTAVAS